MDDEDIFEGVPEERVVDQGAPELEELFGGDDAGEGSPQLDDGPLQPPSPVAPGPATADERRRAMQELARRHQQQGGDEPGDGPSGKKRKRDKGEKRRRDGDEGRKGRRLRAAGKRRGGGGDGGSGDEGGGDAGGGEEPVFDDEVAPETEADRDFIDDDGVPEGQRYRDNPEVEDGGELEAEEAEEGDEGDGFIVNEEGEEEEDMLGLKRRRKRERETDAQLQAAVESMVAKMNIAAELDEACVKRSAPATHKVKALPAVEAFLRQRKHHEFFILHGGLAAAAKWLMPYPDGTMPTLLVRQKMVELLQLLPLNTAIDSLRDVLQRSQLGRVVNFHATHIGANDREEAVRRQYRKLLHVWMEPIVVDPELELKKRAIKDESNQRQRALAKQQRQVEEEALAKRREEDAKRQPGEKGFRKHAYIPTAAKLDYVHNPGSSAAARAGRGGRRGDDEDEDNDGGFGAMAAVAREPGSQRRGGGGGGGDVDPLTRKMRDMQKLRKSTTARAAKVSVEGRGVHM